jgi:hypothetical protein
LGEDVVAEGTAGKLLKGKPLQGREANLIPALRALLVEGRI